MNKKNVKYPEVYFHAFGNDISLYLWPAEGLLFGKHTPVYTVQSDKLSSTGLRYTEYDEYGVSYFCLSNFKIFYKILNSKLL